MGFFNCVLFFIIFHVFASTPIFSVSDSSSFTPNELSSIISTNFLDLAKSPEVFDWMVKIRRKIHEYPELLYEEFETSKLIRAELDKLGIPYKHPVAETGVIGYIGTGKSPFVAIRADMDALAMQVRWIVYVLTLLYAYTKILTFVYSIVLLWVLFSLGVRPKWVLEMLQSQNNITRICYRTILC